MTDRQAVRVTLIAHGSTDAVRRGRFPHDEALDRYGRAAAEGAAGRMGAGPARCSAVRRCVQTAEALGLAAQVDPGLAPWDLGAWHGRGLDALSAGDPDGANEWLTNPDSAPHGGESLTALIDRIGRWLSAVTAQGAPVLAVTEPAIIRAALAYVLPGGWRTFWRVDVGPLDRVMLTRNAGVWRLRALERPGRAN
ncbi:MAG: histidine phosphatase family protein [Pseudonocardiales bacterium]|nr:MAG: histidine phosphatase family protein [Pseudonocardiales bacterium]